ncbi:tetratricopeptide repeat protein [Luteolibacter yonseiensis]|uniref:Tetratricopeptide repeat protein n=1 Tax=Luteolibacter yonseiensis TaxID=1144680 RepID=A0A934R721_9BACT|nr:tetratricopeptide repeat protein [Luteolibacter yonseiensis]MBK1816289.1 tetratricopeptide repeat protein [Luteolibacter yonseiensis]
MIRNLLLGWLCLVVGITHVSAGAYIFDDANAKFKSGDHAGAVAVYEKILENGSPDAAVYYNLGNSYQNLKQYGPAILAYERARLLTPRDPDLAANLSLARKAATAFEGSETGPKWLAVLSYLSRNEWSYLVVAGVLFLGAITLLYGAVRLPRQVVKWASAAGGLAVLSIIAGSTALYLRRGESERGVVLKENAAIRLSPFDGAESLGTPGLGKTVHLGVKNGGYQYVEIPGASLRGWMAEAEVERIEKDP